MPNTRAKGRRNELKARDILERAGYEVQLAPNPTKYSKQNDLWGLFDLCAVSPTSVRFVQVKSNKKVYGQDLEAYRAFPCPPSCSKEIWTFYDGNTTPVIHYVS